VKYVKLPDEPLLDALGESIALPDTDKVKRREWKTECDDIIKKANDEGRAKGLKADDIGVSVPDPPMIEEATLADVVCYFANGVGQWDKDDKGQAKEPAGAEEQDMALEVIRAFRNPEKGHAPVNDKALDWLVEDLKDQGARAFKVATVAAIVREKISGDNVIDGKLPEEEGKDGEAGKSGGDGSDDSSSDDSGSGAGRRKSGKG
jgi:hypothetical protein